MKTHGKLPLVITMAALLVSCGVSATTSSSSSSSQESSSSSTNSESSSQEGSSSSQPTSTESSNVSSSSSSDEEEVVPTFSVETAKAYVRSFTDIHEIDFFYREDKLTSIPYVSLRGYYNLLLGKTLDLEKTEDGAYKLTAASDGVAIIDTKEDTLYSEDLELFLSTTIYRQEKVTNTYYDGMPFVRVKDVETDVEAMPRTLDFSSYDIDLIGLESDVLLPLATASNLFQGPTMLTSLFTSDSVFFIDPNDPTFNTDVVIASDLYRDGVKSLFPNGQRTQEEADFSYNELCFLYDTFYGRPGRESLHSSFVEYGSLDLALENHDEFTSACKTLLCSTEKADYVAGMVILNDYLSDAGHTVAGYGPLTAIADTNYLISNVFPILANLGYTYGQAASPRNANSEYLKALETEITRVGIQNNAYLRNGDTLLYTFNSFYADVNEWKRFYRGEAEMPSDCLGNFKRMLNEYENDASVRNVIVNIANNGGGFGDLVFAFMGLMGQPSYIHYKDMVNKNTITTHYEIDKNFDGVFDEHDEQLHYHYRFGVLSSAKSFSCGNLLPAQAKENGIATLGDHSGGGCCAVLDCATAEGLYTRLSSQVHMVTLGGEEVDTGIPVAKNLYKKTNDQDDFSDFFNFEALRQAMDEYYGEADASQE